MDEENKNTGMKMSKTIGSYFRAKTNTAEEAHYEEPQFEETEKAEIIGKARKEHVKPPNLPAILKATALTAIVIACIILFYILTKAAIDELKRTLDVQQEMISVIHDRRNSINDTKSKQAPVDCLDVLERGIGTTSCVYTVQLRKSNRTIQVMCDMTTDGGGWTVFQYRFSGAVDFNRTFAEYESGFRRSQGEFWLGLKNIYEMTELTHSDVYLQFTDSDGDIAIEKFNEFHLSAGPEYTLHLGLLIVMNDSSNGYNDFSFNNYQKFSTKDKDQDSDSRDCAELRHGGWWYNECTYINPNGHYATPGTQSSYHDGLGGIINHAWKKKISLKSTKLMFRRTP